MQKQQNYDTRRRFKLRQLGRFIAVKKHRLALLAILPVLLVLTPLFAIESHAAGAITFDDGRSYATFAEAFGALSDGDEVTMTVSGNVVDAAGSGTTATLNKNAKVTILGNGDGTHIRGRLVVDGGTLIIGNDTAGNPIIIDGGLRAIKGTLETHQELMVNHFGTAAPQGAVVIGDASAAPVTGRINGGTFNIAIEPAFLVTGSNTTVKHIKGATIAATDASEDLRAIIVESGGTVETITDTDITLAGDGYLTGIRNNGAIGKLDGVNVNLSCPHYMWGIDGTGTIDSIKNCSIKETGEEGVGIRMRGGHIETIDALTIQSHGARGPLGLDMDDEATIGTIRNCKWDLISTVGRCHGIYMVASGIGSLLDTEINVDAGSNGWAFGVYQQGTVDVVSGCNIHVFGSANTSAGYNIIDPASLANAKFPSRVGTMKDTTIRAKNYALGVQMDGTLGVLSGNHFYGDREAYACIVLSSGGTLEEIKSGTYVGTGSGVLINYGSPRDVASGKRTGELKKISYETVNQNGQSVKVGPVFYGKTGWAIRANTEAPAPQIHIEKDPLEQDQPLQGYARYYGGADKTGGKGDGDAIIGVGTEDRSLELDLYPTYGAGTGDEQDYFMSVKNTDGTVTDDVLKNLGAVDISGTTFHYLTLKVKVKYEPNAQDATGDMTDKDFDDEWEPDLAVAANEFERSGYVFTGWNTKADGSGKAYRPGDSVDKMELILYAQWKPESGPEPVQPLPPGKVTPKDPPKTGDLVGGGLLVCLAALGATLAARKRVG